MNEKEKQIVEELSEFLFSVDGTSYKGGPIRVGNYGALALALYDKGYRKQSVGEWVTKGDIFKSYHCSVCNYSVDYPKQKTTYCPECGAKLKGGAE